jgi:hypothetical protein
LPAYANATEWEYLLGLPGGKIGRATKAGKLQRFNEDQGKLRLYKKEHILAWLQIPANPPNPTSPEPIKFMNDSEKLNEILAALKRIEERQLTKG